jgi:hypothetical protein
MSMLAKPAVLPDRFWLSFGYLLGAMREPEGAVHVAVVLEVLAETVPELAPLKKYVRSEK